MLKKNRRCAPKNHPCQVTLRAGSPQEWGPRDRITKLRNKKKRSRIRTSTDLGTELGKGAPGMHTYLGMHKYDERRA